MGLSSQAFRGGGKSGDDKAQDVALGACDGSEVEVKVMGGREPRRQEV